MSNISRPTPFVIKSLILGAEEGSIVIKNGNTFIFSKTLENIDITGGEFENTTIGLLVPSTGRFTSLTSTSLTTSSATVAGNATISGIVNTGPLYSTSILSMIGLFPTSSIPPGWLKANGAAVSRTTYADLFARIGTTYGAGNGTTTFNLPDFRAYFFRGWDDGRGLDAGRTIGSTQADSIRAHFHYTHYRNAPAVSSGTMTPTNTAATLSSTGGEFSANVGGIDNAADSGRSSSSGGTETRPMNVALMVCIKF